MSFWVDEASFSEVSLRRFVAAAFRRRTAEALADFLADAVASSPAATTTTRTTTTRARRSGGAAAGDSLIAKLLGALSDDGESEDNIVEHRSMKGSVRVRGCS